MELAKFLKIKNKELLLLNNLNILNRTLQIFCAEHGIIHERTPPYSPQSNGVAERNNRTLTDLVNAMLDTSGLSKA